MTALYTSGTISLVNGSAVITGIDTAWKTALIVGGTVHVEAEGNPLPILPDDSAGASEHPITDTEMTAAIKWQGATGTYKYALVRENTYTEAQAANSVKIAELLQRLNHPTIAAIAGVQGQQDHLILLTGASTATIIPRTSLIQGIEANATVETPAGLATYESEASGFIVLVSNAGDQRAALYFKRSATAGDWSAPAFLTGAQGIQGEIGPVGITWRGVWNNVDAYAKNDVVQNNKSAWIALRTNTNVAPPVLPVTANADWELFARAGVDGTGVGDVVGPDGGVTNNAPVAFDGTTGKFIKVITGAIAALHELAPAANKLPYFSAENGASLADFTAFARTILDDANGAAMFTTMGATSGTGWTKLPNGRLLQWGTSAGQADSGGNFAVLFPTSFAGASSYNVVAWSGDSGVQNGNVVLSQLRSGWPQAIGFAVSARVGSSGAALANTSIRVDWIAIGVAP
ncbi:gp53-like domain-containing protein [Agrobacterium deltaense]|uniref:gp53-like domain-containing protein n=1 Tax=Agrobacterium deltaense TaxID=1183412 RepID=UPI003D95CA0D